MKEKKDEGNVDKDYQEITNAVVKVVQEKIQNTCWAGVNKCVYQGTGNLLQVNPHICSECTDIKFDREKLFAQIEEIFALEIEQLLERAREEEKREERERIKAAIIESIEKIVKV